MVVFHGWPTLLVVKRCTVAATLVNSMVYTQRCSRIIEQGSVLNMEDKNNVNSKPQYFMFSLVLLAIHC